MVLVVGMSNENAVEGSVQGQIDFYWRPGCPFCMNLERSLEKMSVPVVKHNIWDSPDHAAFVRSVANGNETVPTVQVGGTSMVNPSAREVVAAANREFPGMIAEADSGEGKRRFLRRN